MHAYPTPKPGQRPASTAIVVRRAQVASPCSHASFGASSGRVMSVHGPVVRAVFEDRGATRRRLARAVGDMRHDDQILVHRQTELPKASLLNARNERSRCRASHGAPCALGTACGRRLSGRDQGTDSGACGGESTDESHNRNGSVGHLPISDRVKTWELATRGGWRIVVRPLSPAREAAE